MIIVFHPVVKVLLQHRDVRVELFTERHLIKRLQKGFMESFADAIGLWRGRAGFGVLNVIEHQVEFIVVLSGLATILRAPVGQEPQHREILHPEKRQHRVSEQVCGGNRGFGGVQLGKGHFAVGVC